MSLHMPRAWLRCIFPWRLHDVMIIIGICISFTIYLQLKTQKPLFVGKKCFVGHKITYPIHMCVLFSLTLPSRPFQIPIIPQGYPVHLQKSHGLSYLPVDLTDHSSF